MPDIGEMAWQSSRCDEDGVDTDVLALAGIARRELFCRRRNPAQAIVVECHCGGFFAGTGLYFDKGDGASPLRYQINLPAARTDTPGEDSPAFEAQPPCGDAFRATPGLFGTLSVQPFALSSARA